MATLRVTLTGIIGYVPDEDPAGASRMLAVLPNALQGRYTAGDFQSEPKNRWKRTRDDYRELARHFGYVNVPSRSLFEDGLPSRGELVWWLDGERLSFDWEGKSSELNVLWDTENAGSERGPGPGNAPGVHELNWLPDMRVIAPGYDRMDPSFTSKSAPLDDVVAQVVMDTGTLGCRLVTNEWLVPKHPLGDGARVRYGFAHQVVWEAGDVGEQVTIVSEPFAKGGANRGAAHRTTIRANGAEVVEVFVSNLCGPGPVPWPHRDRSDSDESSRFDRDFLWHYELCDNRDALRQSLNGLQLPIPERTSERGSGSNCFGALFAPDKFEI
jgi:hypothetical protein